MWDDLEFVTLEQAKARTGITDSDRDDDLTMMLEEAHALVLDYIDRSADTEWHEAILAWTSETVPKPVRAAILRQFADLNRFRGDDDNDKADGLDLSPRVKQLLRLYRDPVVA